MTKIISLAGNKRAPFPLRQPVLSLMIAVASGSFTAQVRAQDPAAEPVPSTQARSNVVAAPAPAASSVSAADASTQQVTVTATRRREPAREVPMQVDVLSAEQLQRSGAQTLSDYLAQQPGIDVKTTGGAGLGAINIRGVSTGDQTIATVSTYVDDIAVGSSNAFANGYMTALEMGLLDLNHIEVLRGPQGTLYGAGAMGGLLKYVTNEPDTYQLSGQASLGATATKHGGAGFTESGIVNIPLKEDVAGLRISAFHEHDGGFVDDIGPAARNDANSGETKGARVSVLIEPTNRWKVRLTGTGQEVQRNDTDYVDYDITTGQPAWGGMTRKIAAPEPYFVRLVVLGADVEYDLGWARLNSITSIQTSKFIQQSDNSYEYGPVVGAPVVPANYSTGLHKQTQEFRLTSAAGTTIEWIAGYYFNHESASNFQYVTAETFGDLLHAALPSNYREQAAYGDVTWNVSSKFALTGGMRVARNVQSFNQSGGGLLLGGGPDGSLPGKSAETSRTYLATGKYSLTPESNVYFRIASGYRPGGPNYDVQNPNTGALLAPLQFKHDTLWSYEAGYKADLFNKSLSLEAAVYDIKWNQIQQYTAVDGLSVLTNGGKAAIQGLEISAAYRPTGDLTISSGVSYNDARLTQDAPGLGVSGAPLPNNARFSANLAANYGFSVAAHRASVGINQHWVGARDAGFANSNALPQYHLPKYSMTDIQGALEFQRFELSLFVRNLFNKRAQLNAETNQVTSGAGGPVLVDVARPITVGTTLTAKF